MISQMSISSFKFQLVTYNMTVASARFFEYSQLFSRPERMGEPTETLGVFKTSNLDPSARSDLVEYYREIYQVVVTRLDFLE